MPSGQETTSVYYRSDYCDADKSLETDTDDELCWAASSSNQLWATYWGRLGGLQDEEEVLNDVYQPNFPNAGGHNYPSLRWFLEGKGYQTLKVNVIEPTETSAGAVVFSRVPGGFYKKVLKFKNDWADRYLRRLNLFGSYHSLYHCVSYLKLGNSVNVNLRGFNQYDGSVARGGHALTLWGYRHSDKYPENDVRHIKSIIVSDSDDYQNRPTPYHNCQYLVQSGGRAIFEIPVTWKSSCLAIGRPRGAWVLGPEYAGGGPGYSYDVILTEAVILTPKPSPYLSPEFSSEMEEVNEESDPTSGE